MNVSKQKLISSRSISRTSRIGLSHFSISLKKSCFDQPLSIKKTIEVLVDIVGLKLLISDRERVVIRLASGPLGENFAGFNDRRLYYVLFVVSVLLFEILKFSASGQHNALLLGSLQSNLKLPVVIHVYRKEFLSISDTSRNIVNNPE